MRYRSKKQEHIYRERRRIVIEILNAHPVCERCGSQRSSDVHEIVSRARGGSIVDRSNLVALCRQCHSFITQNPLIAEHEGWSKHSWERDE